MKLFVFERDDWVPFTYTLVCAKDKIEARSLLHDADAYMLCDVYEIHKGVIGEVIGG